MNIKNFKKFAKKPCNFQFNKINTFVMLQISLYMVVLRGKGVNYEAKE